MPTFIPPRLVAWLLGFFLIFSFFLIPFIGQSPRITDALGAALGLWLIWRFATRGLRIEPLVALFALGSIPALWGLYAFLISDVGTMFTSFRWLLAVPWAFALLEVAREPRMRVSLVWGLWWGCVGNVGVLLLQSVGFLELSQSLGLAAVDAYYELQYEDLSRVPGMHNHPNGSAAIVSLIVPFSLYLHHVRAARAWVVIAGLGVLFLGTQFTLTRSSLTVSLVTVLVILVAYSGLRRSLGIVTPLAVAALLLLYAFGLPGGEERWQGNVESNLGQRLESNVGALQVAAESPLGVGLGASQDAMTEAVGIASIHNAFLQLAVIYGPLLAGCVFLAMLLLIAQMLTRARETWALEVMLALHVFGLFFWEEYFNNPTFLILVNWMAAASVLAVVGMFRVGAHPKEAAKVQQSDRKRKVVQGQAAR